MSEGLRAGYRRYVEQLTQAQPDAVGWAVVSPAGAERYRTQVLPALVLAWGGDLAEIFPQTCRLLRANGVALERFIDYFYQRPRTFSEGYDYFKIKVRFFHDFASAIADGLEAEPGAQLTASAAREAAALLRDYAAINEDPATD